MMEPWEIRLSSPHPSKIWCKKRARRIVTHAEKVIGSNWASVRALQQPPEMFFLMFQINILHTDADVTTSVYESCFRGTVSPLTFERKTTKILHFSRVFSSQRVSQQQQVYCRIDGQEKLQLLFIDRLHCNTVMILSYSIKFIYRKTGPRSSCKWLHKYRETFMQS